MMYALLSQHNTVYDPAEEEANLDQVIVIKQEIGVLLKRRLSQIMDKQSKI